jgi:hypothetical protein
MRILLVASFLFICLASSFSGCQKEDLGNLDTVFTDTLQNGPIAKMTAKIDGVPWTATATDATMESGAMTITGEDDEGRLIDIIVYSNKPGAYLLSKGRQNVGTYAPDSITKSYYATDANANTGGIANFAVLDSTNAKMSGQFSFIAARSDGTIKTITEGTFTNIDYTNTTLNSAFKAKKNGFEWNPSKVTPSVVGGKIIINAENIDGSKMQIAMPSNILAASRSYPLTQNGNYTASFTESGFTLVPLVSKANVLTITKHDTKTRILEGTFSFVAKDPAKPKSAGVTITAGVFNITY